MNGRPLTAEHGFPLRLIMPGWYGMAHVKWLTRIEVIDRRYEGRHMARNYQSLYALMSGGETLWLELRFLKSIKSQCRPRESRRTGAPTNTRSRAAWGGRDSIEAVEVQVDGGPWLPATIGQRNGDFAWSLWSFDWTGATPGPHTLVCRAKSARGEMQPTREEMRKRLISNREDNSQWSRSIVVEPGQK